MTDREKEILSIIKSNPMISQEELAETLGIKRGSVAAHISNLTKKGLIKGKGYIVTEESYVVVLGGINVDITGFPRGELIQKDSNPGTIKTSNGGVGRNIAENLARLNVQVKLLSAVGNDNFGKQVISETEKIGVDMSHVIVADDFSTSIYLCVLDDEGDMNVAIAHMDVIEKITIDFIQQKHDLLKKAKAIIVDANLKQDTIDYVLEKYHTTPIFVDTVSTTKAMKFEKNLKYIHTIKPNVYEAKALLGKDQENTSIEMLAEGFTQKGVNNILISDGANGVTFSEDSQIKHYQPKRVKAVNSTGAGDAFMAGLVYGFYYDKPLNESIKIASICSRITVSTEETISQRLTEEQVKGVLENE